MGENSYHTVMQGIEAYTDTTTFEVHSYPRTSFELAGRLEYRVKLSYETAFGGGWSLSEREIEEKRQDILDSNKSHRTFREAIAKLEGVKNQIPRNLSNS